VAQPPDLEARVAALETQVRELAERVQHSEQDAAAARVLAGSADRDVSEMRQEIRDFREQNTRVLNTLRDDMVDGFTRVDRGLTEMRGRLDAAAAGQQQIADMLTAVIARDDDQGGPG
jgi:predicted  nucleic acid-binding Zn-ribbon protein